jgi:tRNA 2-thiouridine synthesizing protein E
MVQQAHLRNPLGGFLEQVNFTRYKENEMLDINRGTDAREFQPHDPEGHLQGLPHWSREFAKCQARAEGLDELSEEHWWVIYNVRGLYRKHGRAASARQVTRVLEKDFVDEGGLRHLYELFPKGPVSQGSRLAGVPPPPYSSDLSFGSVA